MAKTKRPKVSNLGGNISRAEAENIGKRVTEPVVPVVETKPLVQKVEKVAPAEIVKVKPKSKSEAVSNPVVDKEDPMVIVRIRKSHKKIAKTKALELDMNLYEYLELLIRQA